MQTGRDHMGRHGTPTIAMALTLIVWQSLLGAGLSCAAPCVAAPASAVSCCCAQMTVANCAAPVMHCCPDSNPDQTAPAMASAGEGLATPVSLAPGVVAIPQPAAHLRLTDSAVPAECACAGSPLTTRGPPAS